MRQSKRFHSVIRRTSRDEMRGFLIIVALFCYCAAHEIDQNGRSNKLDTSISSANSTGETKSKDVEKDRKAKCKQDTFCNVKTSRITILI